MEITMELNGKDTDMVEVYTKGSYGQELLMACFHRDCLNDMDVLAELDKERVVKANIYFEV